MGPATFGLKLELQGAGLGLTSSIGEVARQVQSEHHAALHQVASDYGVVTIMFQDIAGSTALTEALGDERWLELIRVHNAIVREQVTLHDGREIANRGDGFMVAFRTAKAGVECAIAIQKVFAARRVDQPRRTNPGPYRAAHWASGAGRGQLLRHRREPRRQNRRPCSAGGRIVVSERLRDALSGEGVILDGGREVELKGLSGKHRVTRCGGHR